MITRAPPRGERWVKISLPDSAARFDTREIAGIGIPFLKLEWMHAMRFS